jgi:hypothetical protein
MPLAGMPGIQLAAGLEVGLGQIERAGEHPRLRRRMVDVRLPLAAVDGDRQRRRPHGRGPGQRDSDAHPQPLLSAPPSPAS